MTDGSINQGNSVHKEDLSTLAAGTVIIGQPCVVWDLTVTVEADGDPIVNFSNTVSAYDSTYRIRKVVLSAEKKTAHLAFPKGLYCSKGLCATSNVGGVDVDVTYD